VVLQVLVITCAHVSVLFENTCLGCLGGTMSYAPMNASPKVFAGRISCGRADEV
jgi:hypothetical protein